MGYYTPKIVRRLWLANFAGCILQYGLFNLNWNGLSSRAIASKLKRYNKYLTNLVFTVRTVNYRPLFFEKKTRAVIYSTALEFS